MANVSLAEAKRNAEVSKKDREYLPTIRDMKDLNLAKKNMSDMFESKVMKHTDFSDSDLSGANFEGFNLQGCIFRNTIINGANFKDADLRWSTMIGIQDDGSANFEGADLREVVGL